MGFGGSRVSKREGFLCFTFFSVLQERGGGGCPFIL